MPAPRADGPPLRRDPILWVVGLVSATICLPFFRYVQWFGDEGVVLHGAQRILGGERLYRDFFEILPPGDFLIVASWMKLAGEGFATVRVLAVAVIVAIAALVYASVRLASGGRVLAAALAITWAVLSQGAWTVISHHWLTTAASMAAAVGLLLAVGPATSGAGAIAAGLGAGVACMLTPTRGALLLVGVVAALLTTPQGRPRLGRALAAMMLFPLMMVLHLVATGALGAGFEDVVAFPARHYAGIQGLPFGAFAGPQHAPAVAFFPLTFVLAAARVGFEPVAAWREPRFRAALVLAIGGLIGAFPRPDLAHINFTAPLACPLFAYAAQGLLQRLGRRARLAAGALAIAVCAAAIGYALDVKVLPMLTTPMRTVSTARGEIVASARPWTEAVADLLTEIERVPASEPFFFYPYSPMLPYLTARRHVAPYDVFLPGYTTAEQFRETCRQVARDAQWVVIDRSWTEPRVLRFFFPAMRDADPPEKRAFEAALRGIFDRLVYASPIFELRRRSSPAVAAAASSPEACVIP